MAAKKTPAKATTTKKRTPKPKPTWLRNLRNVHVSMRVNGRKIELAARGQRGDISPLKAGDQEDDIFLMNQGLLFETITTAEAKKIAANQQTNSNARLHPALASMRNELGEPYAEGAIKTEAELTSQGKIVANLDDKGDIPIDRRTGIRRASVPGSVENPGMDVPAHIPPEEAADWVARQKTEGVEAGLGSLRVVRGDVQKGD